MDDRPRISQGPEGSAVWIRLSAGLGDDLNWQGEIKEAERQAQAGRAVFWEIDLQIDRAHFALDDEFVFRARGAALDHFSKTVFPAFPDSIGLSLYRGALDLSESFVWSDRQKQNWEEWRSNQAGSLRRFCLESYAAYFQLLSQRMPEDLTPFLLFDAKSLQRAEALQLLSKRLFSHFEIAVRGLPPLWAYSWEGAGSHLGWIGEGSPPKVLTRPSVGVCFPDESDIGEWEAFIESLDGIDCRMVSEAYLTEEWDDLDVLVVVSKTLHSQAKRKLMGFCASGGLVATFGELLGLSNEVSGNEWLSKVRGRGI